MVINHLRLFANRPIEPMIPKKEPSGEVTYGLGEAGYDIRINQEVRFKKTWYGRRYIERIDVENLAPIAFNIQTTEKFPGRFVIASSMEEFRTPNTMMAIVHDKSSWARRGLSVFNTVIEPGWNGFLTLELVYYGNDELIIPAGSGIAQVIFHQVSNPVQYEGRYQNQPNQPVEAISVCVSS